VIDTASDSRPVSLITFDFDDFKQVNDRHGHAAGDYILRASSAMIKSRFVRPADLFARMGGEEFVIILPDTPLAAAIEVAERIRTTLADQAFEYEGQTISLTSSFGVCTAVSAVEQPDSLLGHADELLYQSKREGRNRVSY
jgi:diguanylate cyclase (GGDEF)-like protein